MRPLHREIPEQQKCFSRSSILSSCLAIEALANCCMGAIGVAGKSGKDFDKLTSIGKLDLYLLSKGRALLDRGSEAVQIASRLIGLRNDFVHPRFQTRKYHDST